MVSLENLYISPLETCNLHCRYCYTEKTKNVLNNQQILSFVNRYQKYLKKVSLVKGRNGEAERDLNLKSIIFCGGELFTLNSFPDLVNKLDKLGIFITIITNGTIDRLNKIKNPNSCQLLVSFDGPKNIHDHNRGVGNYDLSKSFVRHALDLDFPVEIFLLITKESYPYLNSFNIFDLKKTYLIDRLGSLSPAQTQNILNNYPTYPPKVFGCHQISLQSDSLVYPCCETQKTIGKISDPVKKIIKNYLDLVCKNPFCVDPDFYCNLK
jgi:sulfatase maturation enzyme AslB (radical SAM superfamily)